MYFAPAEFPCKTLPASAVIDVTAVVLFAINMIVTLTTGSPLDLRPEERTTAAGPSR